MNVLEAKTPMAKMLLLPDNDYQGTQAKFLQGLTEYLMHLKTMIQEQGFVSFFKSQMINPDTPMTPEQWSEFCEDCTKPGKGNIDHIAIGFNEVRTKPNKDKTHHITIDFNDLFPFL